MKNASIRATAGLDSGIRHPNRPASAIKAAGAARRSERTGFRERRVRSPRAAPLSSATEAAAHGLDESFIAPYAAKVKRQLGASPRSQHSVTS